MSENEIDKLNRTFFRELIQQGRQILVFGPTESDRTSILFNSLNKAKDKYGIRYIKINMTNTMTVEIFIDEIMRKLNLIRYMRTSEGDIKELRWIPTNNDSEEYTGTTDFLILEEVLFNRNLVLVLDYMEQLSATGDRLRVRLAEMAKNEMAKNMSDDAIRYEDSYSKIVFIGVPATGKKLWDDVQSLKSRLATISVQKK